MDASLRLLRQMQEIIPYPIKNSLFSRGLFFVKKKKGVNLLVNASIKEHYSGIVGIFTFSPAGCLYAEAVAIIKKNPKTIPTKHPLKMGSKFGWGLSMAASMPAPMRDVIQNKVDSITANFTSHLLCVKKLQKQNSSLR